MILYDYIHRRLSSYIKCFIGFNFILGNSDGSVLHAFFDKFIKVLQSDHKTAQLIVFIISSRFLYASIAENKNAVRKSQTI